MNEAETKAKNDLRNDVLIEHPAHTLPVHASPGYCAEHLVLGCLECAARENERNK
jgi:hypothetical protein